MIFHCSLFTLHFSLFTFPFPYFPDSVEPTLRSPIAPSASSLQDQALVKRAIAGDQTAFEALLSKYKEPIHHHVLRMVRKSEEVDDLVQECFIKAFNSIESYSTQYAFSTWLYKIATNNTIDYLRKKKLPTFSIDRKLETSDGDMEFEIPDTDYRPDKHILADQRKGIIQEAIDKLPEKYRLVIVMRHQQEKTYEEIARELDLPLGTVKAHIFRAREMLYKALRSQRYSM